MVYQRKKFRKARKLTEEQKAAAAERLRKAREKKGPAQYKNVAKSVLDLPDDHYLSYKNVKKWIKTQKEIAASERRNAVKNVKGAIAREHAARGYINNMNHYIQHGDWISDYYGEYEQHKITWVSITRSG